MEDLEIDVGTDELSVDVSLEPVSLTLDLNSFQASAVPSYTYTTLTPLDTWNINHNLGYKPVVQLFNSGSQMIMGTVTQISFNQTIVTFNQPVSGFARLI